MEWNPSEWKEANITPLSKKASRRKTENFRLVSLTSVLCKLLGDYVAEFLVKHKLITELQHGFLKPRSCLNNYLYCLDSITKCVDDG